MVSDLFQVLRIASLHPIQHYHLPVGTLRIGDPADFCIFEDLNHFQYRKFTYRVNLNILVLGLCRILKFFEVSDFSNLNNSIGNYSSFPI